MSSPPPFAYRPPEPEIEWRDGTPYSTRFDDAYYSSDDGLAETRHVFIDGNRLRERWQATDQTSSRTFTVAETGFGTGLNFIATWLLWRELCGPEQRLYYIATEAYPLRAEQARRALQCWPELDALTTELCAHWPPAVYGQHRLKLDDGRVTLDLLYGDSVEGLRALLDGDAQVLTHADRDGVNAWNLDGFSPARNPEQWQAELYQIIAQLSAADATCASFTAAGHVRRALADAGFRVERRDGFGRKRHMLTARFTGTTTSYEERLPWHRPPSARSARDAVVIGAGLAGCATAAALARRGMRVTMLDTAADCATGGASAIPAALLYTRLSPLPGAMNRFTLASFLHAQRHYREYPAFDAAGVLQLMHSPQLREHYEQLKVLLGDSDWLRFLSPAQASEVAAIESPHPALHFPLAGSANPQAICRQYLDSRSIEFRSRTTVQSIAREGDRWQLQCADTNTLEADVVVIANAVAASSFAPTKWLPLRYIRGQITVINASGLPVPRLPICHEGYLQATGQGLLIGATFVPNSAATGLRDSEHQHNIDSLARALPIFANVDTSRVQDGFAAVRCVSPDYLPLVGAVPDIEAFASDYAALANDAKKAITNPGTYLPGLYLNVAHGSRGLSSTPIAAELIASLVHGEPRPLPADLCRALSPARFVIRGIKRGTFSHDAIVHNTSR